MHTLGNGCNFFLWLGMDQSVPCSRSTSFSGTCSTNQAPELRIPISDQHHSGGHWCLMIPASGLIFLRYQGNGKSCFIQVGRTVWQGCVPYRHSGDHRNTMAQPLGALTGHHYWGPCKYIVMSLSGIALVVVLQGTFHLTLRSVPLPGTISSLRHSLAAGRRERAVNLSRIHNGFGWILFQACIFPQGEWNGSNFRIKFWFWNWTSLPSS